MPDDKQLIRKLEDAHGRLIGVWADHDGVTLDLGLTDRNLTLNGAAELMVRLYEAINAAAFWQVIHAELISGED